VLAPRGRGWAHLAQGGACLGCATRKGSALLILLSHMKLPVGAGGWLASFKAAIDKEGAMHLTEHTVEAWAYH
jgi:hypothetical protein